MIGFFLEAFFDGSLSKKESPVRLSCSTADDIILPSDIGDIVIEGFCDIFWIVDICEEKFMLQYGAWKYDCPIIEELPPEVLLDRGRTQISQRIRVLAKREDAVSMDDRVIPDLIDIVGPAQSHLEHESHLKEWKSDEISHTDEIQSRILSCVRKEGDEHRFWDAHQQVYRSEKNLYSDKSDDEYHMTLTNDHIIYYISS